MLRCGDLRVAIKITFVSLNQLRQQSKLARKDTFPSLPSEEGEHFNRGAYTTSLLLITNVFLLLLNLFWKSACINFRLAVRAWAPQQNERKQTGREEKLERKEVWSKRKKWLGMCSVCTRRINKAQYFAAACTRCAHTYSGCWVCTRGRRTQIYT